MSPETVQFTWNGDELMKRVREETPDALFDGAQALVTEAAANAPKLTGNLSESGYATNGEKSTYKKKKRYNKQVKVKPGQAAAAFAMFYAGFVEFGTKKKAARPFLRPAMDQMKEKIGGAVALKIAKKFK